MSLVTLCEFCLLLKCARIPVMCYLNDFQIMNKIYKLSHTIFTLYPPGIHTVNRPFPDSPTATPNKYLGYNGASPSSAMLVDKMTGQRPVTRRGGRRDRDIITPDNRHRDYMDTDSDIGKISILAII